MNKNELVIALLILHGFERGMTINTRDWWVKKGQEIRIHDKYFSHHKNKFGVLNYKDYLKATVEDLENVIFANYLNVSFAIRLHSTPVITFVTESNQKRRQKRAEKFEKVA